MTLALILIGLLQCVLTSKLTSATKLVACDNFITRNIPGGMDAVNRAADEHRAWIRNASYIKRAKYKGYIKWKTEFVDNLDTTRLPRCKDFHTFGRKFDEMKMFCSPPEMKEDCNVYSLGSNNLWDFEEQMFKDTGEWVSE
jgi:hypothetical protein